MELRESWLGRQGCENEVKGDRGVRIEVRESWIGRHGCYNGVKGELDRKTGVL